MLRSPWAVAAPVLQGLKALEGLPDLKHLLRETQIGKVVNILRHHPEADAAKASKDLVMAWKAACQDQGTKRTAASGSSAGAEPDTKRPRSAA